MTGAFARFNPRSPLRIGIAGLGQAGAALIPAITRHPHVQLVAAADPRAEVRAAFAADSSAQVYAGIEALCTDPSVDLIYVATPTHLHTEHVLAAVAHGKHVIVEKPMATSVEAASTMIDAAAANNVHLIVGHSQSFEPPIRAMRDIVAAGDIGELLMMHTSYYTDWLYRPRNPEELDTALGGGVVFRQGAHQVDLLRWIGGGLLRSVRAQVTRADPARPAEGSHVLFLEFANGVAATAVFSGYDHFHSRDVTAGIGEDGRQVEHREQAAARKAAALRPDAERKRQVGYGGVGLADQSPFPSHYGTTLISGARGDIRQTAGGLVVYGNEQQRIVPVALTPGRDLLIAEAYDTISRDRPAPHDGAWGRANLEVCVAALESARTRTEVLLGLQTPVREYPNSEPSPPRPRSGEGSGG